MSSPVRLPPTGDNPRPDGYKTHWERWARSSEAARREPIELREPAESLAQAEARRELPASIVYWTVGLALGTLLVGLSTRPVAVPQAPLPQTQIVSSRSPLQPISVPEDPGDQPAFVIVLDPLPRRAHIAAADLEASLKEKLARGGFPNIGVSVARDDTVYLAGTLFDQSEKGEIVHLVKTTPGVSAIHFPDPQVRKLYGPAYFGADTEACDGGVKVTKVWNGSPAEMAGIRKGDVITSFANLPVHTPDSLRYMVMSHVGGQRVPVSIRRGAEEETLTVRLGELPALASK